MKKMLLGFVAVALFMAASPAMAIFDSKFEAETTKETEAVKLARDTQAAGYDLLTVAELKKMIDENKDLVIIDTMPYEDSYKKEHIPGAKQFLFPIPDMKEWDAKETAGKTQEDYTALLGADKNKPIIVYCGFVKCTRSHNGAVWAKKLGYTKVYRLPGGIFAWKGANLPIEEVK